MVTGYVIRENEYHDSVFLMRVAKGLSQEKGVRQAAALMGTEANKRLLAGMGVSGEKIDAATSLDLIVGVQAEDGQALDAALEKIDRWLHSGLVPPRASILRTLEEAHSRFPHSNLAVISVPGEYAAPEARQALERGLNVFLFSDHVPVDQERSLKEFARDEGLIVMGPDCGTAIIAGVGIGFANAVRRGPVGVIGASGTGIQEFTTLVHHAGTGISHAIGTGSRDLSDAIGGISTLSALNALESDSQTKVIAVLSKPPGEKALSELLPRMSLSPKPVVACFLGLKKNLFPEIGSWRTAQTIEETAALAVRRVSGRPLPLLDIDSPDFQALLRKERAAMKAVQRHIRGLFAGGTFCYQAQQVLQEEGIGVHSNAPLEGNWVLADPFRSRENTLVDMGGDEFTTGRPHPMIDSRLRRERILEEAKDPRTAVLLLDFVLGYNVSPDPAGDLLPAIREAKAEAGHRGRYLSVVASVCGTEGDPQNLPGQMKALEEAGVIVFRSGARAARFSARLVKFLPEAFHAQSTR
jgi:FdrA protein